MHVCLHDLEERGEDDDDDGVEEAGGRIALRMQTHTKAKRKVSQSRKERGRRKSSTNCARTTTSGKPKVLPSSRRLAFSDDVRASLDHVLLGLRVSLLPLLR